MKRTLNLLTLLLLTAACNAQFLIPDKAMCQKLEGRKLLVVLLDDENDNQRLNTYLQAIAPAYWQYGAVEYIADPYDVSEKVKGAETQYAVVTFEHGDSAIKAALPNSGPVFNSTGQGTPNMPATANGKPGYVTATNGFSVGDRFHTFCFGLKLRLADQGEVASVAINTSVIDSMDIHFFMEQMNVLIKAALDEKDIMDFGKTFDDFSKKMLYLNQADFSESGIKFLAKKLNIPHKLLPAAEFEKMVLAKKQEGVYIRVVYSDEMVMNVMVPVDIQTSRIYGRVRHAGSQCQNVSFTGVTGNVAEMNFKGICAKQIHYLYNYKAQARKYGGYSFQ